MVFWRALDLIARTHQELPCRSERRVSLGRPFRNRCCTGLPERSATKRMKMNFCLDVRVTMAGMFSIGLDRSLAQSKCTTADDLPVFIPLLNGERSPEWDPGLTASFHDLKANHGRAQLAQSVLEGVVFNLSWLTEILQKTSAPSIRNRAFRQRISCCGCTENSCLRCGSAGADAGGPWGCIVARCRGVCIPRPGA